MAEIKQNENRTTSGLPGISAVIRSSSWKLSRQLLLVTFGQHLLLALLFIKDYFRSLAHTTLYIMEARSPIFCIPTRFWRAVAEDVNKKFKVPQSLEEKQPMMFYLTNFHLQCWFRSPANCLQTHFRVPQISTRSKDIWALTIYTIHPGGNFRCKYSVLQLFQMENGKIRKCISINWKVQKEKKKFID